MGMLYATQVATACLLHVETLFEQDLLLPSPALTEFSVLNLYNLPE